MLRTRNAQPTLWESVLPEDLLRLPTELARVDVLLDDERFFAPFPVRLRPVPGPPLRPDHAAHHPGPRRPGRLRGHRRHRPRKRPTATCADQPGSAAAGRPRSDSVDRRRNQTPVQPRDPSLARHRPPSALVLVAPPPPRTRPLVPPSSPTHMIRSRTPAASSRAVAARSWRARHRSARTVHSRQT
jgi:hypothetical protein